MRVGRIRSRSSPATSSSPGASEITADLGTEATRILAQTIAVLCEGQIRETVGPGSGDPIAHYRQVVAEKTGSLIATSGKLGALLSGASPRVVAALTSYGDRIGAAFQISDDLLDITSPSGESGKTPGTDLREGIRTLPVLLAEQDGLALPDDLSDDAVLAVSAAIAAWLVRDRARPRGTDRRSCRRAGPTRRIARRPRPRSARSALRLRGDPHRLTRCSGAARY